MIETVPELAQMLELVDKIVKTVMITILYV